MTKIIKFVKGIPLYGWIAGVVFISFQTGLYFLAAAVFKYTGGVSRGFIPWTPIDDKIPLIPHFILIYVISIGLWPFGPVIASLCDKKHFVNFCVATAISVIIPFIILCIWPSYIDRSKDLYASDVILHPETKQGFLWWLVKTTYQRDGFIISSNLFPSYHCLNSVCCFLGTFRRKEIKLGWRITSLILTILICLSTVFVKQHYAVDVLGGVAIPIIIFTIVHFVDPSKWILKRYNNKYEH